MPRSCGVVTLHDYFVHKGPHGRHVSMVFEVMGPNLLTLIKHYSFQGVRFHARLVFLLESHVSNLVSLLKSRVSWQTDPIP